MEKATILIVDDERPQQETLKRILTPYYNIFVAENGVKALEMLTHNEIDLVTLDVRLPDIDGMDLLKELRKCRSDIDVVIITAYGSLHSTIQAIRHEVAGYILKPYTVGGVLDVIKKTLAKKKLSHELLAFLHELGQLVGMEREVAEVIGDLKQHYGPVTKIRELLQEHGGEDPFSVAKSLLHILVKPGSPISNHSWTTSYYADHIAQRFSLSPDVQRDLQIAALLHDVGNIVLDEEIFLKKGALSEREKAVMKRHPLIGANLAAFLGFSPGVVSSILHHHESYDGTGYPTGLKDDEIPFLARIVSLADAYSTMTSDRPYGKVLTPPDALTETRQCSGSQFDPHLVSIFGEVMRGAL